MKDDGLTLTECTCDVILYIYIMYYNMFIIYIHTYNWHNQIWDVPVFDDQFFGVPFFFTQAHVLDSRRVGLQLRVLFSKKLTT